MDKTGTHNNITITILAPFAGLVLALVLPWLAGLKGRAAANEFEFDKEAVPEAVSIYYVAKSGDGSDGLTWYSAFTNPQDALAAAVSGDEIWVAEGVYYPDEGAGQIPDNESSTFLLKEGVALYGGFSGGETSRSQRDWENNVTVLSGDIDQDDTVATDGVVMDTGDINGNNARHVVTAQQVTSDTLLDGFTITAGWADGGYGDNGGGGFFCNGFGAGDGCDPSLRNIIFSGNYAFTGGGMWTWGTNSVSEPDLRYVTFSFNASEGYGGAMSNYGDNGTSSPSMYMVKFIKNTSDEGGAVYNWGNDGGTSSPLFMSVLFAGNSADYGGAVYNNAENDGTCSPTMTNALFSGNYSATQGGALYQISALSGKNLPTITNATFSGNMAGADGGAIYNHVGLGASAGTRLHNSIMWNNRDSSGTGTLDASIYTIGAAFSVKHSDVQGTGGSGAWTAGPNITDGGNNLDKDPKFIKPVDPATSPTTDGHLGLQPISVAIDAGNNDYLSSVFFDLDGLPRFVDGDKNGTLIVDMGAYEYQIEYPFGSYLPEVFR